MEWDDNGDGTVSVRVYGLGLFLQYRIFSILEIILCFVAAITFLLCGGFQVFMPFGILLAVLWVWVASNAINGYKLNTEKLREGVYFWEFHSPKDKWSRLGLAIFVSFFLSFMILFWGIMPVKDSIATQRFGYHGVVVVEQGAE